MGLLDALIESLRATPQAADLRFARSLAIAAEYGELLARAPAASGTVRDASELPCEKDAIVHALLTLLRAVDAAHREPLRIAFIRLADWQPDPQRGAPAIAIGRPRDPLKLAAELAARRDPQAAAKAAALAEQRARIEELRRLGL